jgi:hypothetical protein
VSKPLYLISPLLAVPCNSACSGSNRKTWETIWQQCCCASAGAFTLAGYLFCSTFVSVATAAFQLMGLSNLHRHMNVLDSPRPR